jgi:hypothetical protein
MSGFLLQCIVGCIFYSVGLIIPRKSPCILIREGKALYPFLSKLHARRVVRFGIVKVYVEECKKITFMYNIQGVPKKGDTSIAPLFIGGF